MCITLAQNTSTLVTLGQGLNNLYSIDKEKTQKIYGSLKLEMFSTLIKNALTLDTLGQGLNNLYSIDKEKTQEIYRSVELEMCITLAQNTSTLDTLSINLNNLYSINKDKTERIAEKVEITRWIEEFQYKLKLKKLNLVEFNQLSIIIILRDQKHEIASLKDFYQVFKNKKFVCTMCNSLKIIGHTIGNLKKININVLGDFDSKLFSFIAKSISNEKFIREVTYFFITLYNQYDQKFVYKAIKRYINQNRFLEENQKKFILYKIYTAIAYQAFMNSDKVWEEFIVKAIENAPNDESLAYIYFISAKNILFFNDGNRTNHDFEKAKENYNMSLSFATEDQKKDFKYELNHFF